MYYKLPLEGEVSVQRHLAKGDLASSPSATVIPPPTPNSTHLPLASLPRATKGQILVSRTSVIFGHLLPLSPPGKARSVQAVAGLAPLHARAARDGGWMMTLRLDGFERPFGSRRDGLAGPCCGVAVDTHKTVTEVETFQCKN